MNTTVIMLRPEELEVDMRYQREINAQLAERIAKHYSEALFSPLLVAERNTKKGRTYYVVDGQHRLEAAKILGLPEVPCFVYSGMSTAEEAVLFVNQQVATRRLTPRDTYKANLFIGNPQNLDVIIDKTMKKYGHRLGVHEHDSNGWWAIVSLRDTVKAVGEEGLSKIFITLNQLKWDKGRAAHSRILLVGMAHAIKLGLSVTDMAQIFSSNYSAPEELIAAVYKISKGRKPTIAVLDVIDDIVAEYRKGY